MYTVIIAERPFIDLYEELSVFLKPLLSSDVVFCEWNRRGRNLTEMLPDLKRLTEFHREWRAIIINQDGLTKINPFDFTGYRDAFSGPAPEGNLEMLLERRDRRFESFRLAATNPLTKLTVALTENPSFSYLIEDPVLLESLLSGETDLRHYMLRSQLDGMDHAKTAGTLSAFYRAELSIFGPEEETDNLLEELRNGDADALIARIEPELLPRFIYLISGADILHSDVEYNEGLVENTVKFNILKELARNFELKDTLPTEVICFAPRTCDYEAYREARAGECPDATDYSNFAQYNLFHDKLKFLVYDLVEEDSNLYAADRMKMMSTLLVLASNTMPSGSVAPAKVYALRLEIDEDAVKATFSDYFARLKATGDHIIDVTRDLERAAGAKLDNDTSRALFEKEMHVPVTIPGFHRREFYADDHPLGLAQDCPQEEMTFWKTQYAAVEKRFRRFLREPIRALKTAVDGPFRDLNHVEDERAFRLNENQKEDVSIKMLEEEREMVRNNPPGLMNGEEFREEMRKADEETQREIRQRMPRSRAIVFGAIALAVYLAGFIPLFTGNLNNTKSALGCLWITLTSLLSMALAGVIYLLYRRHEMKRKIINFNMKMSGILSQIEAALAQFAAYLGHACNYMRGSSVLHSEDTETEKKKRILAHHLNRVTEVLDQTTELFSRFMNCEQVVTSDAEPYDNDYTVVADYDFPVPFHPEGRRIEFLQTGYTIMVPADFLVSITLDRVELYD